LFGWTLVFFLAQVAMANPDGSNLAVLNANSNLQSSGSPQVEVTLQVYENPEDYLNSDQAKTNTNQDLLTIVNPEQVLEVQSRWKKVLKKGMYYVEYPTTALKKHFSEQARFYSFKEKESRLNLMVLGIHVGASAVNWFVFADGATMEQKSFLVAMNAVLYAYLTVNVPLWQKVLRGSEIVVEKYRSFRKQPGGSNDALIGNMSMNFAMFLATNIMVQGILNWSDLSQLVSGDLIRFMLTNSVLGVASTGVWDTSFRKWFKDGRVSESTLTRLNWGESLIMTIISSFIAMGYQEGYLAVTAHGVAGASSLILTSNNKVTRGLKIAKNKLKWVYERSRVKLIDFMKDENSSFSSGVSANSCYQFIR
jgi:hypothetical protein